MSFQKKENLVAVNEECPVLAKERQKKNEVCEYLALVSNLLFLVDDFTEEYLADMKQLRFEVEHYLYKGIKNLDPDFPWDDPFCKVGSGETNNEDVPEGMYEILKEYLEEDKAITNN